MDEGLITHAQIFSVDTAVQARGEATTSRDVINFDLRIRRGGTNFSGAMEEIRKLQDCVGMVFLTDMETGSFGQEPPFPVIWVNWGNKVLPGHRYWPPFGRVIDYQRKKT
jgi:predicted metal-dependent peptidase